MLERVLDYINENYTCVDGDGHVYYCTLPSRNVRVNYTLDPLGILFYGQFPSDVYDNVIDVLSRVVERLRDMVFTEFTIEKRKTYDLYDVVINIDLEDVDGNEGEIEKLIFEILKTYEQYSI